jgi:hypothetical protein
MVSLLISIKPGKESEQLLIAFKSLVAVTHFSFALVSQVDLRYSGYLRMKYGHPLKRI